MLAASSETPVTRWKIPKAVPRRSAGAAAQLLAKEGDYAQIRMPSGEVRQVHADCIATIGQVGNLDHENVSIGKAGRTRWMGKRLLSEAVIGRAC